MHIHASWLDTTQAKFSRAQRRRGRGAKLDEACAALTEAKQQAESTVEASLAAAKARESDLQQQLTALTEANSAAEAQAAAATQHVQDTEQEVGNLRSKLTDAEAQIRNLQEDSDQRRNALAKQVDALQQEVTRLQSQLGADMSQASVQLASLTHQHEQVYTTLCSSSVLLTHV